MRAPFADFLGIKITHISPERIEAELTVRKELTGGSRRQYSSLHDLIYRALYANIG